MVKDAKKIKNKGPAYASHTIPHNVSQWNFQLKAHHGSSKKNDIHLSQILQSSFICRYCPDHQMDYGDYKL